MKRIALAWIVGLLVLAWIGAAHAERSERFKLPRPDPSAVQDQVPVLTLEAVTEAALLSFPGLVAAEQRKAAADGEQLAAEGGFDTQLKLQSRWSIAGLYENRNYDVSIEQPTGLWGTTFFGGWRRGTGNYPVYEGKSQTADAGEVRAGVNIPLWRNGPIDRRRASLAQAELAQLIAGHDYDAALLELKRVVAQRYWDWVFAGRRRAVARELLTISERRDAGLRQRVAAGDAAAIEATDNQRTLLERRERLIAAERMLEQMALQLALYWRDADGEPRIPIPEQLPEAFPEAVPPDMHDLAALVEEARQRRPELRKLEQQRKQVEIERDLARNQQAPGIDIALMGAQDFGTGTSKLINREEFYAGVTLDLPLQRRVARGRTQTAEANLQRLAADIRLAADRVALEIRDAGSALKAARQRIALAREQRATARQLAEAERDRFELGDSTVLTVDLRELAAGDAALAEAEAMATFFKAMADYRAALGWLDTPARD
ncbi:Outer membrane protein TolC [Methylomagnum ishizawai]|uniref:Outer membrane protein TolC n=1 Tax=Methylomagnum ishizawai TaxID=1760988 RepID=A0A1Y6DAJ0_9GAMM|nr:TolC family protein [Methylomagnum ishizawai]SMF97643.1 Outer membrane protein TolC [Methylomagnum ishizawai]